MLEIELSRHVVPMRAGKVRDMVIPEMIITHIMIDVVSG